MFDRPRSAWEQAGFTVDSHTNSRPIDWSRVDSIVIHYTAAKNADSDTARWLAQMQRSYVNGRGYSLGYSCAIDQTGVCWEIRGTDHIPAATKGENGHTFAILQLVDWQNPANPAMIERTRRLVSDLRAHNQMTITGHRDWGATRCPGDGVYHQIETGTFEPVSTPPTPPAPPTPGPEFDMRLINPPQRVFDSRSQGGRLRDGETRRVSVGQTGPVFVNLTVVDPSGAGWLAAWGDGPLPSVSNVNYTHGVTIANSAWVPTLNGQIQLYVSASADVLVDIQAVG